MPDNFTLDNSGNKVSDPQTANPVAASGVAIAMATAGNDYTGSVEQGQMYIVSSDVGFCLLSTTGVTSTAVNVEWTCAAGQIIIIRIPIGKTTLYCESNTNTTTLRLRKLAD